MEKSPLQTALVICAFVANTIVPGCVASYFSKGKNWTTSSLHGSYPQRPSLKEGSVSVQATENGANDWTFQYATHTWNPDFGGSYYGLEATSDVYGFGLRFTQQSGSEIGIYSIANGKVKSGILVGWHVLPVLYQDSNTHFFTFWTVDVAKYG
ncbi:hypothetical protein EJB05_22760 [Eragrostis curvula]|uniref:Neprosin PEP catalytic domain-containing protein n=1 Tax=Eragrostis curvula TaxID=38414 RepID=A0A5J9V6S1_9POAL|nr:hypothetical protein EJB05_22760 [Eragrostis curvula]